jgi:hypothetical protein
MKRKKRIWNVCVISVIIIIIITFSPLVTAKGKINPSLFGLPYTLWMGIILTIALVIITYIGGNAVTNEEEGEK